MRRLCSVLTLILTGFPPFAVAAERPNVLLVMTDDQGFGDIASHGNPYVRTPVQDALADAGARFDRFFVSPVCAPTRASLLTGRYHLRTGVSGVTRGYEDLHAEEVTLAEVLQQAGYATACFGKWHNGRHMPRHPNGQGFAEFVGFCGGHWNSYFNPPLEQNGILIQRTGYIIDIITDEAISFIASHDDQPWFCYVAYNTPHSPWRVPDKYWNRYNNLGLDTKAQCAYAMVENIDDNLGRLLKTIDDRGQKQETIVIFLSDNGANSPRFNSGMKGRKGSVDEGGTRVPFFIRYPGVIAPGTTIEPIAFHLDVLPTLADLCDVQLSVQHKNSLDGNSLVPLLTQPDASKSWPRRMLFTENYRVGVSHLKAAVRTDRWRAVMNRDTWSLFDMLADPSQAQDVSGSHPQVVEELSAAFREWFAEINVESLKERSIPIGHPARTTYSLPANEADLHPGYGELIKYTGDTESGYANSWITDWISTEAYPSWPLEVSQAGEYEVQIRYACRREDVGCQLAVIAGGNQLIVNVPVAHDSPLMLKPDHLYSDNYQDKESWATLTAGTLTLTPGETELAVKLLEVSGARGIELKEVILHRVNP